MKPYQPKLWHCKLCKAQIIGRKNVLEHIKEKHHKKRVPKRFYEEEGY